MSSIENAASHAHASRTDLQSQLYTRAMLNSLSPSRLATGRVHQDLPFTFPMESSYLHFLRRQTQRPPMLEQGIHLNDMFTERLPLQNTGGDSLDLVLRYLQLLQQQGDSLPPDILQRPTFP
jgi:hypothetical protein